MHRKSTGTWKVFCRFLSIMGKPLPLFIFAMIIHMVGDNLFNITLSVFVKNVVEMAQSGDMSGFARLLMWTILAGVVSLAIFFVFGTIYDIEAKRGNAKVQSLVIEKALRMPMSYYDKHHSGEIVSKLLNDADVASQIFTSRLRRVTTPIMSVIVYFIPMFIMNYPLALCLLAVNVVSLVVNSRFMEPMKNVGKTASDKKKSMTKNISTIVSGITHIKVYPGFRVLIDRFNDSVKEYSKTRKRNVRLSASLGGINTFFDMVCALGFLAVSIYFVNNHMATLGSVAAIYTLYGSFSYNFLELGKYLPELMNCIARAQVLFEYLESEEEIGVTGAEQLVTKESVTDSAVEFSDVSFGYSANEAPLYDNFYMKIAKGESVAITGKTGCGKSTLFKLLLGFYKQDKGMIKIMGNNVDSNSMYDVRNCMSYVPQESYLFKMSVMENIRLGNTHATDDEVIAAAKAANAHDFI
ncbi:MAG: ABC transporter ATP-binding protein, partial [Lachnospira sp.]|nr:ABC transporter ATP-binding protein [Lachnospira sp.]